MMRFTARRVLVEKDEVQTARDRTVDAEGEHHFARPTSISAIA